MTKDGERVNLFINAGLLVDLPHISETGADGIGLFRTELQFMVAATLPRASEQALTHEGGASRNFADELCCWIFGHRGAVRASPTFLS